MSFIVEDRASIILYNILIDLKRKKNGISFFLPANVCPIVPATFMKANVDYEFIDIDKTTLNIDLNIVFEKIKDFKYVGLLFVRFLGNLVNVENEFKLLNNKDVFIIDDRCATIPTFKKAKYSKYADITLFSTGYAKYVELGYGGFAYINSNLFSYTRNSLPYSYKDHKELVSNFNHSINSQHKFIYKNSNWLGDIRKVYDFDDYQKIIEEKKVAVSKQKLVLNNFYAENLPIEIQYPKDYQNWRFNIKVNNKNKILKNIFSNELFASSHYACISHLFSDKKAPDATALNENTINLFNDFRFNLEKAEKIVTIINKQIRVN